MVGTTQYDFEGETAIVTGSTKGIGRGIAEGLAAAGANVTVTARTEADVERVADELDGVGSGEAIGVPADVGDPAHLEALVEQTVEAFGGIDLLVNNAAVWPREESLVDASLEDWNHAIAVNLRSQFYASQLVAREMIADDDPGCIVNITSQTGDRRTGQRGLYGISKTAINGLTWRMAGELAEHGIRMNAVSTDVTDSHQLRLEATTVADERGVETETVLEEWGAKRPLGRLGQPEDIADAVMYLASDRAAYVVGTILRVSGGGNLQ
jgi:NAD(P)-dependent dehydrogenase (short-subunit alcohol dehydrogenase family)